MKKIGKLFPIFFVLLLTAKMAAGQRNEIGFSIGGLNYTGDVSPAYKILHTRPAGSLFYRLNISPVVSIRASLMAGGLYGNEKKSTNPVAAVRSAYFSTFISEVSVMAEYNFFNYRGKKEDRRVCPYLTGGLAMFNAERRKGNYQVNSQYIELAIPFGMGIKYKLNRQLNLGAEFVARKTTTDLIDGVNSQYLGTQETSNIFDNDWYYYGGFSLSYTFYKVICHKAHDFAE
jgi:hypothetical protein